jgi:hypothetical protein
VVDYLEVKLMSNDVVKFSMHQQPKTPGYLSNFKARSGFKLVQSDLSAIEPHVIAEFSRDPTMWALYGPGAKPQDIYLFNGAYIELFRDKIREYYDPENPTEESIRLAKKMCKTERNVLKTVALACGFGASVSRVRSILLQAGHAVTWDEVKIIHRDYWKLYAGIKEFQKELELMWMQNGGFFFDIMGTPICVDRDYLHDAVNRFSQRSGHMVLQKYLYHTDRLRRERGVEMYPWIPDFHDEFIYETPLDQVESAAQVMKDALAITNEELGMEIKIKADVEVVDNLAQIKCEDYDEWLKQKETT